MLKVANILEKNGDEYYNNFPIDFENMTFTKNENSIKTWKKNNGIEENATVEEVIEFYKEKYILPLTQENLFYLTSNQIKVN